MPSFTDPAVARKFSDYAPALRSKLLKLRALIFATAKNIPDVGPLRETLKWGQPSYMTTETKSGSTIRLDALPAEPGGYALYFHCQTNLIDGFRQKYGNKFRYEGNRALIFNETKPLPESELNECIAAALTYHLKKQGSRTPIGELINKSHR